MTIKDKVFSLVKKSETVHNDNHKEENIHKNEYDNNYKHKNEKSHSHKSSLDVKPVITENIESKNNDSVVLKTPSAFEKIAINTTMQKNNNENRLKF